MNVAQGSGEINWFFDCLLGLLRGGVCMRVRKKAFPFTIHGHGITGKIKGIFVPTCERGPLPFLEGAENILDAEDLGVFTCDQFYGLLLGKTRTGEPSGLEKKLPRQGHRVVRHETEMNA